MCTLSPSQTRATSTCVCDYDKCKRRSEPRWVAVEAGGKGDNTDKFIYDADQQPISVHLTTAENE